MAIPITCHQCGFTFGSRAVVVIGSTLQLSGTIKETCPRCGGLGTSTPGTYEFVGPALAAFRAPGVTKDKIERFRSIAQSVQSGEISADVAKSEIAQLSSILAILWNWTNSNAGALGVLIAIMTAFLMVYYEAEASDSADDVQREAQQQTAYLEQIHEELRRQNVAVPVRVETPPPKELKRKEVQQQMPVAVKPNRAERRKSASLARRKKN